MAYVRKKGRLASGHDYYQLVENRRIDGKPRQRILMHLGVCRTVDEALKRWPRDVGNLRRRGRAKEADDLRAKLDRLKDLRAAGVA